MSFLGGLGKILGAPFNSLGNITGLHINPFDPHSWQWRRPTPTLMDFINVASIAGGPGFMQNLLKGNFAQAFKSLSLDNVGLKNFLGAAGIKDPSKMQPGDWMRLVNNLQRASAQQGSAGGQSASQEFGGNGGQTSYPNERMDSTRDPSSPSFDWSKGDWGTADWSKETTTPSPLDPNYLTQYGGGLANILFPGLQAQLGFAKSLEPDRQQAVKRAADALDPGNLQAVVDRFRRQLSTNAVEAGKQAGFAIGASGGGTGLAEGAAQAARDAATKAAGAYQSELFSPQNLSDLATKRAGVLAAGQNPTMLNPALALLGIQNQGVSQDLSRRQIEQGLALNRPPSGLEGALPFLGQLAGQINWGGGGGGAGGGYGGGGGGGGNDLGGLFDFLDVPGLPPGTPPPYGVGDDQWL